MLPDNYCPRCASYHNDDKHKCDIVKYVKTKTGVLEQAFRTTMDKNRQALTALGELIAELKEKPSLRMALTMIRNDLVVPSSSDLIMGELKKGVGANLSLDIIAEHQERGN